MKNKINEHLIPKTDAKASESQIILIGNSRITVLKDGLIRIETSKTGQFTDLPTKIVWFRNFPDTAHSAQRTAHNEGLIQNSEFRIQNEGNINNNSTPMPYALCPMPFLKISTGEATFIYNAKAEKITHVELGGRKIAVSNAHNLKGTRRTLDGVAGSAKLNGGVLGKNGVAFFEDNTPLLGEDGLLKARDKSGTDTYIFASQDYVKSVKNFYAITGAPPLVPRYALGNWWSRYYAYTQNEYIELMDKFAKEGYPFSVATIDMDWHYVDIEAEFGKEYGGVSGWTGYSWNKNYFPDYKKFLKDLQDRGLRTSLNLHPAKGVRSYEEQYPDMAEATGTKNGKTVEFDLTDPKFVNAYFEVLHNPYEECGVDSWWIDWQQGTKTKIKGYDPLWGLNHYHYLNSMRNGARGLILSRYAGLGSHRYPLGFSGDAFIVWKSLKFQPYFTANSSNAGYPMWSHDIGGHMSLRVWRYLKRTVSEPTANEYNAELFLRWAQFGVFSPIMRLHSTKMGTGKEPWKFPPQTERLKDALNLRMRLVPYIYTMVKRTEDIGRALIEPLYYDYSNEKGAFKAKREYLFGSELIVAPITSKSQNGLSKTKVWLPKGQFKDIFTHEIIASRGGFTEVSRDFNSIPVFAKEGSIIPLAKPEGNSTKNPKELDIICYKGNGVFKLYEDDSETLEYKNGKFLTTVFELKDAEDNQPPTLKISTEGDLSFAPNGRIFNIIFHDFNKKEPIKIISGVKAGETAILG